MHGCFVKVTIDELDENNHEASMGDASTTAAADAAHVMPLTPVSSKG